MGGQSQVVKLGASTTKNGKIVSFDLNLNLFLMVLNKSKI